MELKHIKGIGPAKQAKLQEAGIKDVQDLAHADVTAVAAKSGISADSVKQYKESAVALQLLQDVKGIGPGTVKTLAEAGIKSLKDLYEASTDYVAAQARVAQDTAVKMQTDAKVLYEHVLEESKTPEGRQKLAAEGRDLAKRAAARTKSTLEDILATAQKEGEAAIAKAKELRETAPARLQEYRQKAEKALHDADVQVKALQKKAPEAVKDYQKKAETAVKDAQKKVEELRHKTEEFARAEAEKFKAANDGFLKRFKGRFGRNQ
jgi:predicted flap endonuclease-1-like 5' DNA nuclease